MNRLVFVIVLLLALTGPAFAQDTTITVNLATVLDLAPDTDGDVIDARAALLTAERNLARTQADPLALRLDIEANIRQVAQAQDDLAVTIADANITALTAYNNLLTAQEAVDLARLEREIAATKHAATVARYEAGAATALEVAQAENDVAAAERNEIDTSTELRFALETLAGIIGTNDFTVAPIDPSALPERSDEESVLRSAEASNTRLRAAERAVTAARAQLAAVDNDFSPRSEIEAAQQSLTDAEHSLAEMRTDLPATLRRSLAAITSAESRYTSATASLVASVANLAAQAARLEAGSISPLAYRESELAHLTATAARDSAMRALLQAYFELDAAVLR